MDLWPGTDEIYGRSPRSRRHQRSLWRVVRKTEGWRTKDLDWITAEKMVISWEWMPCSSCVVSKVDCFSAQRSGCVLRKNGAVRRCSQKPQSITSSTDSLKTRTRARTRTITMTGTMTRAGPWWPYHCRLISRVICTHLLLLLPIFYRVR